MLVLGLVAALVASLLFNVGVALQGLEARSTPKRLGLKAGLLVVLFRRRLWLAGLVLGLVGIAPQVYAFTAAPFILVQPALSVGLLVLLAIGVHSFGESVGATEIVGVVAIIGGVALLAWGAPPHHDTHRSGIAVILVVAALCAGAVVPFVLPGDAGVGYVSIFASGFGFAASNVATKLMSDDVALGHLAPAALWAAVALCSGIVATLTAMTAFQHCRATTVVPVSTAVQTFLPILAEPLFLRESWRAVSYYGIPIVAGLIAALVGTVLVSRTRAVAALSSSAQS